MIADEIGYWISLGRDVEWELYAHDRAADLRERLLAVGFEADEVGRFMARYRDDGVIGGASVRALTRAGADVAAAVVFLASPGAGWITGEVMDVNGGQYLD